MIELLWKVLVTVATGCPDYKQDPYTGEYPNACCAVSHTIVIEKDMCREFETQEEVDAFIKGAPAGITFEVRIYNKDGSFYEL
jgi:hypothetical protein